jgi:hypothetical protein
MQDMQFFPFGIGKTQEWPRLLGEQSILEQLLAGYTACHTSRMAAETTFRHFSTLHLHLSGAA